MLTPTTIDDIRSIYTNEGDRDVFTVAAVLPHIPDGEALIRVRQTGERVPEVFTDRDELAEFERRVPTVGAAENTYRVEYAAPPGKDTIESKVHLKPRPHNIKLYEVGTYDVDILIPVDSDDSDEHAYDFSDTDQTALTDWGVAPSVAEYVLPGYARDDDSGFDRDPVVPV